MTAATPKTELVYGDGGEGLVFLEKDYATDVSIFRSALNEARTWGELRTKVSEERYQETLNAWLESESERLADEEGSGGGEPEVPLPGSNYAFDPEALPGYADGDWPEFAPHVMETWVDKEVIRRYGHYVYPTLDAEYPVIDPEKEEEVVSLLEGRGYSCVRDDDAVWEAVWGG